MRRLPLAVSSPVVSGCVRDACFGRAGWWPARNHGKPRKEFVCAGYIGWAAGHPTNCFQIGRRDYLASLGAIAWQPGRHPVKCLRGIPSKLSRGPGTQNSHMGTRARSASICGLLDVASGAWESVQVEYFRKPCHRHTLLFIALHSHMSVCCSCIPGPRFRSGHEASLLQPALILCRTVPWLMT